MTLEFDSPIKEEHEDRAVKKTRTFAALSSKEITLRLYKLSQQILDLKDQRDCALDVAGRKEARGLLKAAYGECDALAVELKHRNKRPAPALSFGATAKPIRRKFPILSEEDERKLIEARKKALSPQTPLDLPPQSRPITITVSDNGKVSRRAFVSLEKPRTLPLIQPKQILEPTALKLLKQRLRHPNINMHRSLLNGFKFDTRFTGQQNHANALAIEGLIPHEKASGVAPLRLLQLLHSGYQLHEIATGEELTQLDAFFLKKGVTTQSDISLFDACERDEQRETVLPDIHLR